MSTDRREDRIKALGKSRLDVLDLAVELESNAHVDDPLDLGIENVTRQAVFGNAETHHAAGHGTGLADGHRMAQPA